ncbi:URC4/urg3 family protein [Scytonema millei]|uniref:URC4/urg3 family protein n=1 Tax=Scytonema millei VB511283 TaxID=1245923 RepID=A0A9X5E9L7_9CYAN|nr:URC4/urg3 family protein [Scytonema millei]NHC37704.1 URC4/urg3 family protein [Scytonema millei VB511283]
MSILTSDSRQSWEEAIAYLRSPQAIRDRCGQLFELAQQDKLSHFRCDLTQLGRVADYVITVMQEQYPDGQIPFHSRWQHFEVGGVPRLAQLERMLAGRSPVERAVTKFDLAIVSVLLDAGAGDRWVYCERETDSIFQRSEGLAVASFRMFCQGAFSSHPHQLLQVDAQGLQSLSEATLAQGFQVSADNPLVGLAGRVELLQKLGRSLLAYPQMFGDDNARPGHLVHYLLQRSHHKQLPAATVLRAVLDGLGSIWSGRIEIAGVNLGDVWYHPALEGSRGEKRAEGAVGRSPSRRMGAEGAENNCQLSSRSVAPAFTVNQLPTTNYQLPITDSLVPFHKLSQWLTYSLLEPLQELGLEITGLDDLTGLPEYRNGGLCLDLGLLQAKHSDIFQQTHSVDSEVVVEWRALTVILLDKIAATIRQQLEMDAKQLPLVKILQGGTWSAGRRIAAELRPNGVSPIQLQSDGTVF